MYHNSGTSTRRPSDPDEHTRRDSRVSVNTHHLPSYNNVHSPTQYAAYSPTNGVFPPSPYNQYPPSRPSTSATMSGPPAISPRLGPPPSPKVNAPSQNSPVYAHRHSSSSSKYYDPTTEYREAPAWSESQYPTRSPVQVLHSPIRQFGDDADRDHSLLATRRLSLTIRTLERLPRPIILP